MISHRRTPATFRFEPWPLHDLVLEDGQVWVAGGFDPQLVLDHPAFPLQPGWYRVQADFAEIDGRIERPCLYPDFGEGISEATRVDLFPDLGRGRLDQLVHITAPLISLRFDPSTCPAKFRLGGLTLTPVQPLEARWLAMDALLAPQLEYDPALASSTAAWGYGSPPNVAHIESVLARTPLARETGRSAYALWCDRQDRLLDALALGVGRGAALDMPWLTLLVEDPANAFTEASLLRFNTAEVQVIRVGGVRWRRAWESKRAVDRLPAQRRPPASTPAITTGASCSAFPGSANCLHRRGRCPCRWRAGAAVAKACI